jgi:hypothetical protein
MRCPGEPEAGRHRLQIQLRKGQGMNKQDVTTFVWGIVAGGIGLSALLFGTGWAIRADAAERDASIQAQSAVAESLAKICLAQYGEAPDRVEKLAALKQIDTWSRGRYVTDQGWATMPGSTEPSNSLVAGNCADLIIKSAG